MADTKSMLNFGIKDSGDNLQGYNYKPYPKWIPNADFKGDRKKDFVVNNIDDHTEYLEAQTPEGRSRIADKKAKEESAKHEKQNKLRRLEEAQNKHLTKAKEAINPRLDAAQKASDAEQEKKKAKKVESKAKTDNTELFEKEAS